MSSLIVKPSLALTGLPGITANSASISISANSLPVATLDVCPAGDNIIKIRLKDISAIHRQLHEALQNPSKFNLIVSAHDGRGNSLEFAGRVINVNYGGSVGAIGANATLTPTYSFINSYKTFLYASIFKDSLNLSAALSTKTFMERDDTYLGNLNRVSGSIAARVKEIIKISKIYNEGRVEGPGDADRFAEIMAYEINNRAEPLVMQLLDDSDETTLIDFSEVKNLSGMANLFIAAVLADKAPSFMAVLQRLNESFLMAYCPSLKKNSVGILKLSELMFEDSNVVPVEIDASSLMVARENAGIIGLPPSGLILRSATRGAFNLEEIKKSTAPLVYALAAYPPAPDPYGHIIEAQAPLWMSYIYAPAPSKGTWLKMQNKTEQQIREIAEGLKKSLEQQQKEKQMFAKKWAKIMYLDAISKLHTQTIITPLDFSEKWQIGTRYNVNQLFNGTLVSITHNLNISNKTANTRLIFSGVTNNA